MPVVFKSVSIRFCVTIICVFGFCTCSSQSLTLASEQPRIIPDESGLVQNVICHSGSGIADFFTDQLNGYSACVIYPRVVSGTFVSETFVRGGLNDMDTLVVQNKSWAYNSSFDERYLQKIQSRKGVNAQSLSDWIELNQPLGQNYSILGPQVGEELLDLSKLSLEERTDFVVDFSQSVVFEAVVENDEIVWTSIGNEFAPIVVRKSRKTTGLKLNDKVQNNNVIEMSLSEGEKLELLNAQRRHLDSLESYLHSRSLNGNSIMPLMIEAGQICYCSYNPSGLRSCSRTCNVNLLKSEFGRYFQDRLHVRNNATGSLMLNTANADFIGKKGKKRYCEMTEDWAKKLKTMPCSGIECQRDVLCGLAGGNMFVTEQILFIGTDERHRILASKQLKLNMGLKDNEKDDRIINNALLTAVYGNDIENKSIVWVGTDRPVRVHSVHSDVAGTMAYQPIYHIDLFFNPLGTINHESKDFYYLICQPEEFGVHPEDQTMINDLKASIEVLNNAIQDSLKRKGFTPIPIEIPFGVNHENRITERNKNPYEVGMFVALCNGIFEKGKGSVRYLFPRYSSKVISPFDDDYKRMENAAQDKIHDKLKVPFKLIFVESATYTGDSALRCQVKVIARGQ